MPLPPQVFGGTPTALDYRPADTTLVTNNTDLGEQAECVLGCGANVPAGTTRTGFTDTTYTLTRAQILLQTTTGQC